MADVDVVIPVRFGLKYLPEAVRSALLQHDAEVAIWIVDDAADADLDELLGSELAGSCTIVTNTGKPGIGGARNTGAALGSAPLLAFLDCDDLWPADRTNQLRYAFEDTPGSEVAFGMVEQFAESSSDAYRIPPDPAPGMLAGGMLLQRNLWNRLGGFDEELPVGEFVDWVARLRSARELEATTDEIVLRRRIHGDNTTLHRMADRAAYAAVVREHLRRSPSQ